MSVRDSLAGSRSQGAGEVALVEPGLDLLAADLRRLSDGNVVEIRPSGPVLNPRVRPRRAFSRELFAPALNVTDRALVGLLSLCWLACLAEFWYW